MTALRDLCDWPASELVLPEEERQAFRDLHCGLPDPCVMKAIGAVLLRWATMGTGATKPSLACIAESIGRSKRCVSRNLRGLERFGVIRFTLEARRKKRQPRTYSLIVGRQLPGEAIEARRKKRPQGPTVKNVENTVKHGDNGAQSEAEHFDRKAAEQQQFTRPRPSPEQRNREAEAAVYERRSAQQAKARLLERLAAMSPERRAEAEAFLMKAGSHKPRDGLARVGDVISAAAKSG